VTNLFDTFKFVVPKEEEYLELTFSIDARQCIEIVALRLLNSQSVNETLEKLKESFSKVLLKIMDFMLNQLQGRIRVDYNIGEIIPHRQIMIAKLGILDTVLYILTLIQNNIKEPRNTKEYLGKMAIPSDAFDGYKNLLEVIIKTLHVSILNNQVNTIRLIKQMYTVQDFIFVKGCPSFLIDIFKDSNFELNKKEIHWGQLYRRIYEIDRFEEVIKYLVKKLIAEDNYIYLVILRKMCIIDDNPLPMVQKSIFELLYKPKNGFQNKYSIIGNKGGDLLISKGLKGAKGYVEETSNEFFNRATVEQENFLLEQLSLEAGLWYGRNEACKEYFKTQYPCDWLLFQIQNSETNMDLKGNFIRLLNYIYIDDSPHKLLKMSRAFKAFKSSNEQIVELSSERSVHMNKTLNEIIKFIKEYIEAFTSKATGINYFKSFDMEFVRMINYLLRFGLFIYRDNKFQTDDVDFIFSYLCYILDIFTSKDNIKSVNSMDKIISKDTILSELSKLDPIQRAAYDVKYHLLDKSTSNLEVWREDFEDYSDKNQSKYFHVKMLTEIITVFHLFNDLRQHYLLSNNVEFFYNKVYTQFYQKSKTLTDEDYTQINQIWVNEFTSLIPKAKEFKNHLEYKLPSIDEMFKNNELAKFRKPSEEKDKPKEEKHEEFVSLMIDSFNLHSYSPFLRQQIILMISRYQSERAEFIRNLDRTVLFFDENDWLFYSWVKQQLDKFVVISEEANVKMHTIKKAIEANTNINLSDINDLNQLKGVLSDLKEAIVHNANIHQTEGEIVLVIDPGDRKINSFTQELYRNLKVYDYLINFLFQNQQLFLLVRKVELKPNTKTTDNSVNGIIKVLRSIFRNIFKILELMATNNFITQELLWKYKNQLVFEELGGSNQEGELELLWAIFDDSEQAIKYNQNKYKLNEIR
jgi:hypothetical protein